MVRYYRHLPRLMHYKGCSSSRLYDAYSIDQSKCSLKNVTTDGWELFTCSRTVSTCVSSQTSIYTTVSLWTSPVVSWESNLGNWMAFSDENRLCSHASNVHLLIDLDINILTDRPNHWHNSVGCHVTALSASGIMYIQNIV